MDSKTVRELIYKTIVNDPDPRSDGIHITQIAKLLRDDGCKRQVYYDLTSPVTPHDAKSSCVFFRGKGPHRELAYRLAKEGWTVEEHLDESNGSLLHGTPDAYKDDTLLDFKTANFIPRDQAQFEKYYAHYINQVKLYAARLQQLKKADIKSAYIIFFPIGGDKPFEKLNDIGIFPVSIMPQELPASLNKAEELAKEIQEFTIMGHLPSRNVGWSCDYCPFIVQCMGDGP